jgi:periodic tryptophan protein 1
MISALVWVPAGVANPSPKRYEMSNAEKELIQLMEEQGNIEGVEAKLLKNVEKNTIKLAQAPNDVPDDLRMDEYSSDEDDVGINVGKMLIGNDDASSDDAEEGLYEDNNSDPKGDSDEYDSDDDLADVPDTREFTPTDVDGLTAMGLSDVGGSAFDGVDDDADDDSELEDTKLTADDNLVVVAKTEDDFASLEVHVYNRNTGNMYVHHDIPLPAYPLCLAHGQVSSLGTTGNFCAVGTFETGIEIWNLDVLNALEPSCILGGEDTSAADDLLKLQMLNAASASKKTLCQKIRSGGLRSGSHKDAVMCLSWNTVHKQVIASGSADMTVKLWDVTKAGCNDGECNAATFSHHKGKVQSVAWHPSEGTLLATGSYDRTVALVDARSSGRDVKRVKLPADCEALAWDPHHPEHLTVASEDGSLKCWDVRSFETATPVWSMIGNEFGVSNLSYNYHVPGMLAICSPDKTVSLWDCYNEGRFQTSVAPWQCGSKDMCSGKLHALSFYPSDPWLLGCGGSGNQLALWDLSNESIIIERFGNRLKGRGKAVVPKVVEFSEPDPALMVDSIDDTKADGANDGVLKNKKKKKAKKNKGVSY